MAQLAGGFTFSRSVPLYLEGGIAYSRYDPTFFGDQAGALGFNHLTSAGLGLELDSSAYDIFISRTRLVGRYVFGKNITGFSIGLAVSF